MAETQHEMVLRLRAESSGFNKALKTAQIELYKVQAAGVKASGGQKAYEAAVKQARIAITQANGAYRQATTSLKLQELQINKTSSATKKLSRKQSKMNMTFTQGAYALDDMQYGFQGVQNNIQAMAVSAGAGGPLVVGITVITVAIGKMVQKYKEAGKEAKKLRDALTEKQGLLASMLTYAEVVKQTKEGTAAHEEAMKKLRKNGFRGGVKDLNAYIDQLKALMKVEAAIVAKQSTMKKLAMDREDALTVIREMNAIGGDLSVKDNKLDKTGFLSSFNVRAYNDALLAVVETTKKIGVVAEEAGKLQKDVFNNSITKNKKDPKKTEGGPIKSLFSAEEIELNDEVNEAIDLLAFAMAENDSIDNAGKLLGKNFMKSIAGEIQTDQMNDVISEGLFSDEQKEKMIADMVEVDEATKQFRDSVGGAFSDLGNTIAMNLGGNGDAMSAFLGAAIGTYTQLLSTNKAFLAALIPMKATEAGVNAVTSATETASKIPFGAFVLPALIAGGLAAVSSAFSSAGASGGGMSGGGGGGSKPSAVAAPTPANPVRENARVRNSNLIIPMDMMRYGMQNAEDNYSGFN